VNILITGGFGFIGKSLIDALIDNNHITVIDSLLPQVHGNSPQIIEHRNLIFIKYHLGSGDLSSVLPPEKFNFDVIIHLASETGTGQSMYLISPYVLSNVMGTAELFDYLVKYNLKIQKFILSSSRSVYGEGAYLSSVSNTLIHPNPRLKKDLDKNIWDFITFNEDEYLQPIPTHESLDCSPISVYAETKLSQENLVRIMANVCNYDFIILRLQNVYGEGQSLLNPYTGIMSIFYNQLRQDLPIQIYEDGLQIRDFVHISDVKSSFVCSLDSSAISGIYNIGSGLPISILDIATRLSSLSGYDPNFIFEGKFRLGDIRACYADISSASDSLNWKPQVSVDEGLLHLIEWANTQPIYKSMLSNSEQELSRYGISK